MKVVDEKRQAIITLRPDGSPSEYVFVVSRQVLNDDDSEVVSPQTMHIPATMAQIQDVLESGAFAQNAEVVGLHAQIDELRTALNAAEARNSIGAVELKAALAREAARDVGAN